MYGIGSKWRRGRIWWVKIFDGRGKPIRKSTRSENEADADDMLGQLLRERARGELGTFGSSAALNLSYVLDEYMARKRKLAPGTVRTYRSQIDNLLKPYFGLITLAKLTTDMLTDYREMREKENVKIYNGPHGMPTPLRRKISGTCINRELGLLRAALPGHGKTAAKCNPFPALFPDGLRTRQCQAGLY
jgi:hypothetical protein